MRAGAAGCDGTELSNGGESGVGHFFSRPPPAERARGLGKKVSNTGLVWRSRAEALLLRWHIVGRRGVGGYGMRRCGEAREMESLGRLVPFAFAAPAQKARPNRRSTTPVKT